MIITNNDLQLEYTDNYPKHIPINVSEEQLNIIRNMIGLNYQKKPYRNYYTINRGGNQYNLEHLCKLGLAEEIDSDNFNYRKFKATQDGIDMVYTKKKKKKKDEVIRIGDIVTITNSKIIKRVGYPLCHEDIIKNDISMADKQLLELTLDKLVYGNMTQKMDSEYKAIVEDWDITFGISPLSFVDRQTKSMIKLRDYVIREVAHMKLKNKGFGGDERSIHYQENAPDLMGVEMVVVDKQVTKTGTRIPGYTSSSYFGDDDSEGPSFQEKDTHVILTVKRVADPHIYGFDLFFDSFNNGIDKIYKIEDCNVRKAHLDGCLE